MSSSLVAAFVLTITWLHVTNSLLVDPKGTNKLNSIHLVDKLKNQIRAKEEELLKAEAINRNFERMIQLVNILGQIDTFLSERAKAAIKKLAVLMDSDDSSKSRSSFSDERD